MSLCQTEIKEYLTGDADLSEEEVDELETIKEDGFWTAGYDSGRKQAYVMSDDPHHDAVLYISGDFGSAKIANRYAEYIAERLNRNR